MEPDATTNAPAAADSVVEYDDQDVKDARAALRLDLAKLRVMYQGLASVMECQAKSCDVCGSTRSASDALDAVARVTAAHIVAVIEAWL